MEKERTQEITEDNETERNIKETQEMTEQSLLKYFKFLKTDCTK
jgi:hypothetical protein